MGQNAEGTPTRAFKDAALAALQEVAGPCILLDNELRILAATKSAHEYVGGPIPTGVLAAKILCGSGPGRRPVAEALAQGRAVSAEVARPSGDGVLRTITIRALPLNAGEARNGWLLLLQADVWATNAVDETVDTWGIITRDGAMKQLLRQVYKVARTDASVLIRGETGAGKELVASAIHRASKRQAGPFRAINCAALPPALLESELFGHVRGAFTGAVRDAPGHFRLAEGGTLFLDEVAELPLEVQAKLLRVLQERTVIPVGGSNAVTVNARIVAATHRSLRRAVGEGMFRADLMYRLRVVPLFLPPLRQRPLDIELLATHFAKQVSLEQEREILRITPGALRVLQDYSWPGNVRELRNVIEYASVMGEGPLLSEADLPAELLDGGSDGDGGYNAPLSADPSLPAEAKRLLTAIERAAGHHGRAAASLGISRVTLWRKLRKFGIEPGLHGDSETKNS